MADSRRRERALVFAALGVSGLGGLVMAGRPWWRAVGAGVNVPLSGTTGSAGLTQALAIVLLAGGLLGLTLRARGRRVLAALLVLAALGMLAYGAAAPVPSADAVAAKVQTVSLAASYKVARTPWSAVYAACGLLAAAAAGTMLVRARRWPARPDRFAPSPSVAIGPDPDPLRLWRALDAGVDPTDPEYDPRTRTGHNETGVATATETEPRTTDRHTRDRRGHAGGPGTGGERSR